MEPKDYVKSYMLQNPAPARGLILDIEQKPPVLYGVPGTVNVIYYSDNFEGFSTRIQEDLADWLTQMSKALNETHQRSFVVHLERRNEAPR